MSIIGIDIEQFARDPYATGIQRVLQQLALHWPSDVARAEFIVPIGDDELMLLPEAQAARLLALPFAEHKSPEPGFDANHHLRLQVEALLGEQAGDPDIPRIGLAEVVGRYDAWLLPEVSYLPSVLARLELVSASMRTAMIGYDALPMTEPANYRHVPGVGANVSEYFRLLATVDAVACISDWSRDQILSRLRRDPSLVTTVAHPGGDHLDIRQAASPATSRPTFVRLGTMEARKRPQEILRGFLRAVEQGTDAELLFIGNPNASAEAINEELRTAVASGVPVRWVTGAADAEVYDLVAAGDAFLSIGIEGYGIPVLEAIRLGTPCLFDGIQPAGKFMVGKGAAHVDAGNEDEMAAMFAEWGKSGALDALRASLRPDAVPSWSAFARDVALSAAGM